jgi:hypothetical protein
VKRAPRVIASPCRKKTAPNLNGLAAANATIAPP